MAKSAKSLSPKAPSLAASKRAAKAPSAPVVLVPAPAAPAPVPAPVGNVFAGLGAVPAPAAPAPAALEVVQRRGSSVVIGAVTLGTKAYVTKCDHTAAAWVRIVACLQAGPQPISAVVQAMGHWPKAEKPSAFVRYCINRHYLSAA